MKHVKDTYMPDYLDIQSVLKRERLSGIITHRFTVDFQAHLAGNRPVLTYV